MNEMILLDIFVFGIGACVGSFLNVCIVRMPHEKSVITPRSHCVACKKQIAWYDNIPIFSYFILGGKCRHCQAKFSLRYPLVELFTALVFIGFYKYYGLSFLTVAYWVMVSCFIVATFVDFEHRIIPDEISVGGMYLGIILSAMIPAMHQEEFGYLGFAGFLAGIIVIVCLLLEFLVSKLSKHTSEAKEQSGDIWIKVLLGGSLLLIFAINFGKAYIPAVLLPHALSLSAALSGYIIGGGAIYLMGLFGDLVFRKESMGGGDVKLMALVGAFMGWKLTLLAFFLAPFFGAVYGIVEKIRTKDSAIAYGPFLVAGSLISLFYGNEIIRWIISGYGLR